MVELDYFSTSTFIEALQTINELRPLSDFQITDDFTYEIPISRPSKVICLGRNYAAHARESGNEPPSEPIIFAKAPSSLIPHQGTILIPKGIGRVDHEVELAVIIGKTGKSIPESNAMDYVAGYTIVNDVTARDRQFAEIKASQPWFLSKGLDTFGPIGPYLVPKDQIPDPHKLDITLKINGEIKQKSNTSNMIFSIPELIAFISRFMTLNCGDIISTGTPEGISPLKDGDIVEAEIPEIGILRNFVFDAPAV
ncbi:fumarylacetoacetate hydrolase family protein [candidate division KSB1 bacterium]|nr:fumarylacetoacetate hydrolase family protein [candidate division KSB1 bacterium]